MLAKALLAMIKDKFPTGLNLVELDTYTSASLNAAYGIAVSGTVAYVAGYSADSITSIDIT